MNRNEITFDIIRFTASKTRYAFYSDDWKDISSFERVFTEHTNMSIPLGHSRCWGPVMDLPEGLVIPENMHFTAQLDLSKFSPFDKSSLLPKSGQLIFFSDLGIGKVIYTDISNDSLVRIIKEDKYDFGGALVESIYAETETMDERYRLPEDEEEAEFANEDGKLWEPFAGTEKSKFFGIFTQCQYDREEIEEIAFSNKLLLLQIGQNDLEGNVGFQDEGVLSVLIDREDLAQKNFNNCEFIWGQS